MIMIWVSLKLCIKLFLYFENLPVLLFLTKRAALGNLKVNFHCAHWHRFFPLRKAPPLFSVFSNSLYDPFGSPCRGQKPQGREDVTALRCSEPLRYKVGGPSKVCAILCGMGPPMDNKLQLKVKIGISTFIYLLPLRLFKEGDIVTLQLYNL